MVHDQDLHTSSHKSLQLLIDPIVDHACFMIELGDLQLGKSVQFLNQILELLIRYDTFLFSLEFCVIHRFTHLFTRWGILKKTFLRFHVMYRSYLLQCILCNEIKKAIYNVHLWVDG